MKIKVGILGGAFDPVTKAHTQIAKYVLNNTDLDEVWLMPTYRSMHKPNMIPAEHRLEMCRLAVEELENVEVCTYEVDNKLEGLTFNILTRLKADPDYKKYSFSVIIGMDQANNMETWVNYDLLKKTFPFVVVPRKGYRKKPSVKWFTEKPHTYLKPSPTIPNVASTEVRFAARNLYSELEQKIFQEKLLQLDEKVLNYVKIHRLYE